MYMQAIPRLGVPYNIGGNARKFYLLRMSTMLNLPEA